MPASFQNARYYIYAFRLAESMPEAYYVRYPRSPRYASSYRVWIPSPTERLGSFFTKTPKKRIKDAPPCSSSPYSKQKETDVRSLSKGAIRTQMRRSATVASRIYCCFWSVALYINTYNLYHQNDWGDRGCLCLQKRLTLIQYAFFPKWVVLLVMQRRLNNAVYIKLRT
jgi:hypothetical protein